MKQVILILVILSSLFVKVSAQDGVPQPLVVNSGSSMYAAIFGGYFTDKLQDGYYQGGYLSTQPLKAGNLSLGLYAMMNHCSFKNYVIGAYKGSSMSFEAGPSIAYWFDVNDITGLYASFNFGIKYSSSTGESHSKTWLSEQSDYLVTSCLSLVLVRNSDILPRSQLYLAFQKPIDSRNMAAWENKLVEKDNWDLTNIELQSKFNLCDILIKDYMCISPKIILGYAHYGLISNSSESFNLGIEAGYHEESFDDDYSIFLIMKMRNNRDPQYVVGGTINFII